MRRRIFTKEKLSLTSMWSLIVVRGHGGADSKALYKKTLYENPPPTIQDVTVLKSDIIIIGTTRLTTTANHNYFMSTIYTCSSLAHENYSNLSKTKNKYSFSSLCSK